MPGMRWDRAKRYTPQSEYKNRLERWADRILQQADQPKSMKRHTKTRTKPHEEITIVVGENSPTNTTGQREVHTFPNLKDAHQAGFTWAV